MVRWVIALFAVAAALAAPGSLAQVVLAPTVFATHDVPSNTITTFTVSCPPGYVAVSVGISKPAPGTTLLGIRPVGIRAHTFRLGNPASNADQRVTAAAACRKIQVSPNRRAPLIKVKPLTITGDVPAGKVAPYYLRCPPGTVAVGSSTDISPSRQRSVGAFVLAPAVSVRKATSNLRGFSFLLRNAGRRAQPVAVYGNCLTILRPAGSSRERIHIKVTTSRAQIRPGKQKLTRRCPRGWVSLAVGFILRSPVVAVDGAAAVAAGGQWWITSDSAGANTADLELVCGRLGR